MRKDSLPQFLADASGYLIDRDRKISYSALDDESRRLARGLYELGIRSGDRVAIWLPNVPAWLASFFACARLGAIAVAMNTRFRSHEVGDILRRSACRALIYWPGFRKLDFDGILADCPPAAMAGVEALIAYSEDDRAPHVVHGKRAHAYADLASRPPFEEDFSRAESGCVIFTTSGTTSAPKFVLHDQETIVRHARQVGVSFGYADAGAIILVTAPFCGAFGFCNATAAIAACAPLVMQPTFDARQAAEAVRRHAVTHANATDDMFAQMLDAASDEHPFPSVRFFGYAAFSPALSNLAIEAEYRGLTLVGLYGSSEMQALIARQDASASAEVRAQAGGRLIAEGARVRACDPENGVQLPNGQPGELEFKVPSRMVGYLGDEAATRTAFREGGWFRSGDLGYTIDDSAFVFVSRLGDSLRLSGFLVSPGEIEQVLQAHDSVQAAQVVGVETPTGAKPVAFVIPRPGAAFNEATLVEHCAARIARYKLPIRIAAVREFPATPGANATKIQKSKLREMARQLVLQAVSRPDSAASA